jgi:hypothetical protein
LVEVQDFHGSAEGITDRSSKQAAVESATKLRIGLNPGKGHFSLGRWGRLYRRTAYCDFGGIEPAIFAVCGISSCGNFLIPSREFTRVVEEIPDSNMKATYLSKLPAATIFAGLTLLAPCAVYAQAPAGPLPAGPSQPVPTSAAKPAEQTPEPPPRTTILGAWKFNADDSDDPRKKMQQSRSSNGGGGGRGRIGGGWPGGGGGGYGGHRGGSENDEEREKMRQLFTPAKSITLSMTGAEVDLVDDQSRKRAFMTDGRKLQKSKDENYQEIAAKWDGNRLITDEKNPRGGKMSRALELSYDGRQLYETLHMTTGRSDTPLVIRYVYDIPAQTRQ